MQYLPPVTGSVNNMVNCRYYLIIYEQGKIEEIDLAKTKIFPWVGRISRHVYIVSSYINNVFSFVNTVIIQIMCGGSFMAKKRHLFPGANSCYGFYSLYDYMVQSQVKNKVILKGGPGTGKSSFMKKIAEDLGSRQIEVEYHWCSSDNNSLDGVVGGHGQICVLDGTSPHVVDPRYPGAVDRIINLGEYWDASMLKDHRENIQKLTDHIGLCFRRAYNRLAESQLAHNEWISYIQEARDNQAVNRNILALSEEFLQNRTKSTTAARHLFAGAVSPGGIVSKAESLLDSDFAVLGVMGSPGGGCKELLQFVLANIELTGVFAEVFHCPFDPKEIDMIIIPDSKTALVDFSASIIDYETAWPTRKFKRFLDFDQFLDQSVLDSRAKLIFSSRERFEAGIRAAVAQIKTAKDYHDELESFYVPAMDFDRIEEVRQELLAELLTELQ